MVSTRSWSMSGRPIGSRKGFDGKRCLAAAHGTPHVGPREGLTMNLMRLWQTLYPLLRWIAVAVVIFMFWQALPMDMIAIAIAGDMVTYLEIAAAAWLIAQVTRVRWVAAYTRNIVHRI